MNPVLPSLKDIIENPKHVFINEDKISDVVKNFKKPQPPKWNNPVFPDGDDELVIDFFMLFNTINFKFWDFINGKFIGFDTEYAGVKWSGAFACSACLKRGLEEGFDLLNAEYLANFSVSNAEKIFRGSIRMPLLEERVLIFREVGRVLLEYFDGKFHNVIKNNCYAFNDGDGIVELLVSKFPSFNDCFKEYKFYKRAQLVVGMLSNKLDNFVIKDIDDLTVFADYRLPQALRELGIINYSSELAEKVDNRLLIPSCSREELEIRAFTIYASDLLIKKLNNHGLRINALDMDYFLWRKGKNCKKPYHLTETVWY